MKSFKSKGIVYTVIVASFFYLGNKLSQSWQAAPGNSFGIKFLNIKTGVARAFNNPFPSMRVEDIIAGLAAVLIIFAAVYLRKMSVKKFRLGEEYGSARWSA